MRLLLDKNLSYRLAPTLQAHGHDVVHVDEVSLGTADDRALMVHARSESRIIVSSDTDLGALLAAERATQPSVVLTRGVATLRTETLAELLAANLEAVAEPLRTGAVVALGRQGVRVRRLPLR